MKIQVAAGAAILFVAGIGVGYSAKMQPSSAMYRGKDAKEAAQTLLQAALVQAGKNGSWERIGAGRVYYLGGFKAEGQAIFDALLSGKAEDSDLYRIARIYEEAGEWAKAKPLFDRYLAANPEEGKDFAEVGSYYLLHGDRATAEKLFDRALELERDDPWTTERIAGAYLGVQPMR